MSILEESLKKIREGKAKQADLNRIESVVSNFNEVLKAIQMVKGDKGEKPTKEELLALIEPLIPEPVPGKDYILTENDKKEIAKKIKVPVIEKIIEKTQVIREQPTVTNEIKQIAVTDTAEQLKEKLNSLGLLLLSKDEFNAIIDEKTKVFRATPRRSKAHFEILTITGTKDGSNREFYLSRAPRQGADVFIFLNGQWIAPDYYTLTGLTLILDNEVPAPESTSGFYASTFSNN